MWPQLTLSDTRSHGFHHLGKQTWLREPSREQESQLCLVTCRMSPSYPTRTPSVLSCYPCDPQEFMVESALFLKWED